MGGSTDMIFSYSKRRSAYVFIRTCKRSSRGAHEPAIQRFSPFFPKGMEASSSAAVVFSVLHSELPYKIHGIF